MSNLLNTLHFHCCFCLCSVNVSPILPIFAKGIHRGCIESCQFSALLSTLHTLLIACTNTHTHKWITSLSLEELIVNGVFFKVGLPFKCEYASSSIGSYSHESIYHFLTKSQRFWTFRHLLVTVLLLEANSTAYVISSELISDKNVSS